jgi:hypothetical protein
MQDSKYADSIDQERATQDAENKNLLTDTDYPAPNKEQKELSKDYATGPYDHAVVKNAYKSDFTIAGGKTPPAVSTNDFPMGDKSPVGSNQNRLPQPKSSAR